MSRFARLGAPALLAAVAAAQGPAITVYNQDFAVVRDRVPLDLVQGANDVRFAGVTTRLEPDSVVLRDPKGQVQLAIVEQNYRADVASPGLMLSQCEGKEIEFLRYGDGPERIVRGKVIRSGYRPGVHYGTGEDTPIIEIDGKLRFQLPGQPIFPAFADDAILVPTLQWKLHATAAAKLEAEVGYVTGGMSWQAAYNVVAPEQGDLVDIVGWITIDNQSGKVFRNATVKLMAGDVHKVKTLPDPRAAGLRTEPESAALQVTEKAFDEFHLYSLPLATTLHDRQQTQVEFVRAANVVAPTIYVYDGAALGNRHGWERDLIRSHPDYGKQSTPKVWVMRELANSQANALGMPLPKGRVRFYRRDDTDGRLEFTGENTIDHTPVDEVLRIYTGDAFDLVGERTITDFKYRNEKEPTEEAFQIRVRNKKGVSVEVRVFERLYRWHQWRVIEKSHEFVKVDAASIEFRVQVPANGETVVTYRVSYP